VSKSPGNFVGILSILLKKVAPGKNEHLFGKNSSLTASVTGHLHISFNFNLNLI